MLAKVAGLRVATRRLALVGLVGCLSLAIGLAGCGGAGGAPGGGTTNAPTATATATPQPTTCTQVQGFTSASGLTLPNIELPAGAIAPVPTTSFGGTGQYTIKTYTVCVPNTTSDLVVSTGKGPEPLAHLLSFYGWDAWTWETLSNSGDGHEACAGSCFAFNLILLI